MPPTTVTVEAAAQLARADKQYWEAFDELLTFRLKNLSWKPFHWIKVFKLGLHWVAVLRIGQSEMHYWVAATWDAARQKAEDLAAELREQFAGCYATAN